MSDIPPHREGELKGESENITKMKKHGGFTLLELLVAISIFSILSLAAYAGLRAVLTSAEHSEKHAKRLGDIQKALTFIEMDLTQIAPRDIRTGGDKILPAIFIDPEDMEKKIEFTRAGRANVMKEKKSGLQSVAYIIRDNKLIRANWLVLDRTDTSEPLENVLLDDVEELSFFCLNKDDLWVTDWNIKDPIYPKAVKVVIELKDYGVIFRIIKTS